MFLAKKNFSLILLILTCFMLTSCGRPTGSDETAGTSRSGKISSSPRQPAPDFSLVELNGRIISLSSMKGKVVLLNFWSTGCDPCKEEMPQFQELYKKYKDKGFVIIGVSLDPPGYVKWFVQAKGLTFPIVYGDERTIMNYGGIQWIPTTFLIDREGNIVKKIVGPETDAFWKKNIEALL